MRRQFLILFTGLLICFYSNGQSISDTIKTNGLYIRFNPSGLINIFEENLSFGAEYKFKKKWFATLDVAWIFHSYSFEDPKHVSGIILRPAVRYYLGTKLRRYVEGEIHYKSVTHRREDWLGHDCINDVPAYEEFTQYRYRKINYGFHIKTGMRYPLDKDSRFFIDVYLGLGVHHRTFKIVNKPGCCRVNANNFPFVIDDTPNSNYIAIPMGGRLVYRLK
jgi:hypothetical protein